MRKILSMIALCLLGVSCHQNSDVNYKDHDVKSDREITRKVKRAILTDRALDPSNRFVSVSTTDGVVVISGNISDKEQMRELIKKVESVPGVRRVNNEMTVSDS